MRREKRVSTKERAFRRLLCGRILVPWCRRLLTHTQSSLLRAFLFLAGTKIIAVPSIRHKRGHPEAIRLGNSGQVIPLNTRPVIKTASVSQCVNTQVSRNVLAQEGLNSWMDAHYGNVSLAKRKQRQRIPMPVCPFADGRLKRLKG